MLRRWRTFQFILAVGFGCTTLVAHAEDAKKPAKPEAEETATQAPVAASIDVRPGDRWTYQVIDDVTGETKMTTVYTVTELRDKTYSVQVAFTPYGQTGANTGLQVFDETWDLLDDPVWSRRPADPATGIHLPLKVGSQWKAKFSLVRKNPDNSFNVDANIRVQTYEPVILKFNKTYDAFKIEINEALTNSANSSVGTVRVTQWYAPSVNRYVKRITETRSNDRLQSRSVELLSAYARRHDDN